MPNHRCGMSFGTRIAEKEKIDHYQDLKVEIQKMWGTKDVGALTKKLIMWVTKIRTPGILNLLQKACLFGNSKGLKKDPRHLRL